MDQKVITLIISVVAILATLISSLIGHYFTAKARTSSYKQFLYGKQVDLLIKVIHKQGRFKIYATLLMPDAEEYAERARNDIGDIIKDFSILTEEAAAIIPTELWLAIRDCLNAMDTFVEKYDSKTDLKSEDMVSFTAIDTKVALMTRSFIGADKLSDESVKLFSTKKEFYNVTNMEVGAFEELAGQKNKNLKP